MIQFSRGTDYKAEFIAAVNELIAQGIEDRQERIEAVNKLIDRYITDIGESPEDKPLEWLTDYILREELTDTDRLKVRNEEYPFFSARQLERRESGEAPFKMAEEVGTDGRSYKEPGRRKRAPHENNFVDAIAKSRNKERKAQYKHDTRVGEVVPYQVDPEALDRHLESTYGKKYKS